MRHIKAAVRHAPLWGGAFFVSILVLIGVAPFSIFMSEFLIVKEAFFGGRYLVVGLFLFSALAVFVSALKHVMDVSFGEGAMRDHQAERIRLVDRAIVSVCLIALLVLGLWIPSPVADFLKNVSIVVENGVGM